MLDVIKKIAIALNGTTVKLIFEVDERIPGDNLALLLEGASQLDKDAKHVISEMIKGMLVKHQTMQMINNLSS